MFTERSSEVQTAAEIENRTAVAETRVGGAGARVLPLRRVGRLALPAPALPAAPRCLPAAPRPAPAAPPPPPRAPRAAQTPHDTHRGGQAQD